MIETNALLAPKRPDPRTLALGLAVLMGLGSGLLGCTNDSPSASATSTPPASPKRQAPPPSTTPGRLLRVGNQASGIEDQPDYNKQALAIRRRVNSRLPRPLPDAKTACNAMLDAVLDYYKRTDGPDSIAAKTIEQTRDRDLDGCIEHTAPAAASCVALLAAERAGEYPWLLDQCDRAFPKSG